jgi:heme-degrading monooxygenase HmoA
MPFISKTPRPPYYAVVFTSINADVDHTEHRETYKRMVELAQGYEGYLGIEPARNPDGSGVAVVYWKDHESILAFARDPEHMIAKRKGREIWYSHYMITNLQGRTGLWSAGGMMGAGCVRLSRNNA